MTKNFDILISFQIIDPSGTDVGCISKQWMGALTEFFMDKDTFKIDFPENITLETKAVLLGATMLVVNKNLLLLHKNWNFVLKHSFFF